MARLQQGTPTVHKMVMDFVAPRVLPDGSVVRDCPECGLNCVLGLDWHMNSSARAPGFAPLPQTVALGDGVDALHRFRVLIAGPHGMQPGQQGAWPYRLLAEEQ
jgi:hypothetical protein